MSESMAFDLMAPIHHRARRTSCLMLFVTAGMLGCTDMRAPAIPEPLSYDKSADQRPDLSSIMNNGDDTPAEMTVKNGRAIPQGRATAEPFSSGTPPKLSGESISVTFDGIPLPTFVNTVFNELLKVTFEIDDAVAKRQQLVTLRTAEPITPENFYRLVTDVLQNYGISVVYQNSVYRVVESANRRQDLPRIVTARASRSVPNDLRPVFQFVQLKNIQVQYLMQWLSMALKNRIEIQQAGIINAVIIIGQREDVDAALETIEVLDQPHMAGAQSKMITPVYWSIEKLADQLVTILTAEGYIVGTSPDGTLAIKLIPIIPLNSLIVFTPSPDTMKHVIDWAQELDQPSKTVNKQGMFYFQVENSSAPRLVEVLSQLLGGGGYGGGLGAQQSIPGVARGVAGSLATPGGPGGLAQQSGIQQGGAGSGSAVLESGARIIVDSGRNAIIFQGSAEEFSQFRALAKQMDRSPMEVLIEATIAEVTLNEGEDLNIALGFDDNVTPAQNSTAIRSDKGILVSLVHDRGEILSRLSASSNQNKVTILSSPRVIASSGVAASIQVGTQVPIITTQQTAPDGSVGGTSTLLQDVQYRSTGVVLSINPVVNSRERVELTVSQEVSEAQANRISTVQSPAIFTRSINTQLSLNDGETALLGGLISENFSDGDNGIPYLKDVPVLGNLFKTQSRGRTRIELIVLLTPYIIDSRETARAVRDAFRDQLTSMVGDGPETSTKTGP